jgi:hypothetical protein
MEEEIAMEIEALMAIYMDDFKGICLICLQNHKDKILNQFMNELKIYFTSKSHTSAQSQITYRTR